MEKAVLQPMNSSFQLKGDFSSITLAEGDNALYGQIESFGGVGRAATGQNPGSFDLGTASGGGNGLGQRSWKNDEGE
jgi:hypothetical protein